MAGESLRIGARDSPNERKTMLKLHVSKIICYAAILAMGGCMLEKLGASEAAKSQEPESERKSVFHGVAVRYQVSNVDRSIAFYSQQLGFSLEDRSGPAFAKVSNGNLTLWLSGPKSSGSRPTPDGRGQGPGGWNRIVLEVDDLPSRVAAMKKTGIRFRNEIETGPGGKQIQLEDLDGNPIELFEPAQQNEVP
jgi:glyoxylase I family protein